MADTEDREQQQQIAMQRAFGIYKGIISDERGIKARKAALKDALARVDIDWKAFLEALKRAQKDEHTLNLFDTACARIEGWARKLIAGEKLVEAEDMPDDDKEPVFEDDPDAETEDQPPEVNDDEQAPAVAPQPAGEEQPEPQPIPAAAESDGFEEDPAIPDEPQAEAEPEWDMGDAPAADSKAAQKTARVAPAAGASGVSMDDIPMPKSQIHDLQEAQKKRQPRQFVDRNERMPAAQYNELVKAGSGQG